MLLQKNDSKECYDAISKECQNVLHQIKTNTQRMSSKTKLMFVKDKTSEESSSPTRINITYSTPQERRDFVTLLLE